MSPYLGEKNTNQPTQWVILSVKGKYHDTYVKTFKRCISIQIVFI